MRSILLLGLIVVSTQAFSATPQFKCYACRDVATYPRDFGNFAFNLVFGDEAILTLSEGDRVLIENPAGQWAIVDLAFVLEQTGLTFSVEYFSYTIPILTGQIRILVQDQWGETLEYSVFADSPSLMVGDGTTSEPSPEPISESDAEPDAEPALEPSEPDKAGDGTELIDWGQEGTYYWYEDLNLYNLQFGNE